MFEPSTLTRCVSALVAGLLAVACGGPEQVVQEAAEQALEEAAGAASANVDVGADGAEVRVETSDGTLAVGGAAQSLPDNFPGSMPLPDDYEVHGVVAEGGGEFAGSFLVTLITATAFDDLVALYDDGLPDGGWNIASRSESDTGGARAVIYRIEGKASGVVQVADDPAQGLRIVTITIG